MEEGQGHTSHDWLLYFADLTQSSEITNQNVARALRRSGLYTTPSKGRGHLKTKIKPSELTNFLLAQAAAMPSEAVEVVTNLRRMKFLGSDPYFGTGNLGEAFDRMIEGQPNGEPLALPHEIILSARPYRALMVWRNSNGKSVRGNTYAD